MRRSIVESVYRKAKNEPDKTAVVVNGNKTSYSKLFELVNGYSNYLRECGIKKGDIVITRASQDLDYVVIYLSIHLVGGIVTSLERTISDAGMTEVAKQLGAKSIICDNGELKKEYDAVYIMRSGVCETAERYSDKAAEPVFPELEDSADILFTTGTTGASKGVELSHKALVATAENLIYGCGYKEDTFMIAPGPLNHANAIRKLFTTFVNGSTICILAGMTNVKAFFTALDTAEGTIACCLPPAAIRTIFQLTKDRLGQYADRIDFIESATSPLPEPDKLKLCELLPKTRLYNNYGSSEAASVCMYDYNKYPGKDGCIGKAMPNSKIIIVDDDHKPMQSSKDRMGLIACVGDVNMKRYVNEPELTAEVLQDGVIYTSDIGYIDDEGFIYIAGRKGDVINVGGLKVAPTEVESAALGYEGIDDCICIPVDDNITGKALKLLVVLADGAELDRKSITEFLSKKLEAYKIPRFYEKVDKVERTYNGKLNRKAYNK